MMWSSRRSAAPWATSNRFRSSRPSGSSARKSAGTTRLFIHLTLVPYIAAAGELKTKPTQHSVRDLMEIGIQPDILICRSEQPIAVDIKRKIALFCNVDFGCVIESPDVKSIYEIPLRFSGAGARPRGLPAPPAGNPGAGSPGLEIDDRADSPAQQAGPDRGGREVHRPARRLQIGAGGADPWRHSE